MLRLTKCKSSHNGVRQICDGSANLSLLNTTNKMRFQLRKFLKHCSPEAERLCQGKYLFYMCLVFNPFSIASVTGKQAPRLNRPLVWPLILVHLHYVFFFFFISPEKTISNISIPACQRMLNVPGALPAFWDSLMIMWLAPGTCAVLQFPYGLTHILPPKASK